VVSQCSTYNMFVQVVAAWLETVDTSTHDIMSSYILYILLHAVIRGYLRKLNINPKW
jgi:hypothetical protein